MMVVNRLSKMIHVVTFAKASSAPEASQIFLYLIYGYPRRWPRVSVDKVDTTNYHMRLRPSYFKHVLSFLFRPLKTKITLSSADHPKTERQTKTTNKRLEETIMAHVVFDKLDWDFYLTQIEMTSNSSIHTYTFIILH